MALSVAAPPGDLRLWLGEDRLLRLSIECAADHAASAPGARAFRHGDQSFPTAQLLALMAFCYLTARLDSVEIEEELETDETLRYLCAGRFPSSPVLRQFRRSHRDTLTRVLADLLSRAIRERANQPWRMFPGAVSPPGSAAASLIGLATELGRHEAEARLARAVLADTMALDI
jgi:hypothetical protein